MLASRVLPGAVRAKQPRAWPLGALVLAAALLAAGCGSPGDTSKAVHGAGYSFLVPADWNVKHAAGQVTATPGDASSVDMLTVSTFRLERPYRTSLYTRVVPELDSTAAKLAGQLGGQVTGQRTITISARRARQEDIAYTHGGKQLAQQITFVLEGRREFELLCRREQSSKLHACVGLTTSFRLG